MFAQAMRGNHNCASGCYTGELPQHSQVRLWELPELCVLLYVIENFAHSSHSMLVSGWPDGYAFILSFLAPLWAVGVCSRPSFTKHLDG